MTIINDPARAIDLIKSKRLLIFDFDGVLADSVEVKTEAFAEVYKAYGSDVIKDVVAHHRNNGGMSRFDKFKHYHNTFLQQNIDIQSLNELSELFSQIVVDKVIKSAEIAHIGKFLEQCCERGHLLAVNSAAPTAEVIKIINARGLWGVFNEIYGSPGSKIDNFKAIKRDLSVDFNDCVFFGDASADFNAAHSVGMEFIGIGQTIAELLEDTEGRWFGFDDFRDLVCGD